MHFNAVKVAIREMRAIQDAEREVAPVVGPVLGMDSAAEVYGEACRRLGINVARVAPAGMADVFRAHRSSGRKPALAMDASSMASLEQMIPGISRIRVA